MSVMTTPDYLPRFNELTCYVWPLPHDNTTATTTCSNAKRWVPCCYVERMLKMAAREVSTTHRELGRRLTIALERHWMVAVGLIARRGSSLNLPVYDVDAVEQLIESRRYERLNGVYFTLLNTRVHGFSNVGNVSGDDSSGDIVSFDELKEDSMEEEIRSRKATQFWEGQTRVGGGIVFVPGLCCRNDLPTYMFPVPPPKSSSSHANSDDVNVTSEEEPDYGFMPTSGWVTRQCLESFIEYYKPLQERYGSRLKKRIVCRDSAEERFLIEDAQLVTQEFVESESIEVFSAHDIDEVLREDWLRRLKDSEMSGSVASTVGHVPVSGLSGSSFSLSDKQRARVRQSWEAGLKLVGDFNSEMREERKIDRRCYLDPMTNVFHAPCESGGGTPYPTPRDTLHLARVAVVSVPLVVDASDHKSAAELWKSGLDISNPTNAADAFRRFPVAILPGQYQAGYLPSSLFSWARRPRTKYALTSYNGDSAAAAAAAADAVRAERKAKRDLGPPGVLINSRVIKRRRMDLFECSQSTLEDDETLLEASTVADTRFRSGYRGVYRCGISWCACVLVGGDVVVVGRDFETRELAATAVVHALQLAERCDGVSVTAPMPVEPLTPWLYDYKSSAMKSSALLLSGDLIIDGKLAYEVKADTVSRRSGLFPLAASAGSVSSSTVIPAGSLPVPMSGISSVTTQNKPAMSVANEQLLSYEETTRRSSSPGIATGASTYGAPKVRAKYKCGRCGQIKVYCPCPKKKSLDKVSSPALGSHFVGGSPSANTSGSGSLGTGGGPSSRNVTSGTEPVSTKRPKQEDDHQVIAHDEPSQNDVSTIGGAGYFSGNTPTFKRLNRPKHLKQDVISLDCDVCGVQSKPKPKNGTLGIQGSIEGFITCCSCGSSAHPSCVDLCDDTVVTLSKYEWRCMNCKSCETCHMASRDKSMMFCDVCDRGYHSLCAGFQHVPRGRWVCKLCGVCASCGIDRPNEDPPTSSKGIVWRHQFAPLPPNAPKSLKPAFLCTLCDACSDTFRSGCFCPICLKVYQERDFATMVNCETCRRRLHKNCEGSAFKSVPKCKICEGVIKDRCDTFHATKHK